MDDKTNFLKSLFSMNTKYYLKYFFRIKIFLCLLILNNLSANANNAVQEARHLDSALEKVFPSVVNISIAVSEHEVENLKIKNSFFPGFFKLCHEVAHKLNFVDDSGQMYFRSVGSGIIVDRGNGYIVTNDHVIKDSSEIFVTLYNKRIIKAKLLGSDPVTDIAVLKIDCDDLSEINFADLKSIKIGRFVAAIGNPLQLEYTATFGIISGINRTNLGIEEYENFIQTDASINKGNSGGALVDIDGKLVGMNTAVISGIGSSGFGLAIPINTIQAIYKKIVKYGKIERGRIGLHLKNIKHSPNNINRTSYLMDGVAVYDIDKDSPAEIAGLKVGDIIVSMDEKPVSNLQHVKNQLVLKCVSENIKLKFLRNNEQQNTTLIIK